MKKEKRSFKWSNKTIRGITAQLVHEEDRLDNLAAQVNLLSIRFNKLKTFMEKRIIEINEKLK